MSNAVIPPDSDIDNRLVVFIHREAIMNGWGDQGACRLSILTDRGNGRQPSSARLDILGITDTPILVSTVNQGMNTYKIRCDINLESCFRRFLAIRAAI